VYLLKFKLRHYRKYGDPIGQKICGVKTESIQLPTRLHQWRIERCAVNTEQAERRSAKRPSGSGSDREDAFAAQPPWSSVNNCTKYNNPVDKDSI